MDAGFVNPLQVEFAAPWKQDYDLVAAMVLLEPLVYKAGRNTYITVPAGFTTDGASVPKFLRWAVPHHAQTMHAAVLHDYLLTHCVFSDRVNDGMFYEALRVAGVGRLAAWRMYLAVRVGSLNRWARHLVGEERDCRK